MGILYLNSIPYTGGAINYVELTQAQYNALPQSKKLDGTIYFITDGSEVLPQAEGSEF